MPERTLIARQQLRSTWSDLSRRIDNAYGHRLAFNYGQHFIEMCHVALRPSYLTSGSRRDATCRITSD